MAAELAIKITADGKAVVTAAKQAETALLGIDAQADKTATHLKGTTQSSEGLSSAMRELDKSAAQGGAGIQLLAKGATMATAALLTTGVAVGAGFVSKLVAVQREFDILNSSMVTVTGSSANAAREMAWIKTFAKETPFGLEQAANAFVKMKALGLDPSQKALTSYGNTASAMGKDLSQMIEAVADASTGEFERLKEFGIKAQQNGDQVSLTFQGVTKSIGNNAAEITGYLQAIGEKEFGGAMAERAKTLDGVISGLADSWDELFRTIGAAGVSQAMTNGLSGLDNYLTGLTDHMNAAKDSGAGMVGELSSGLGYLIARAPFDLLSSSANLLNGTLNLLTGGALGLNTSVNLLPDAFKTSAQQAVALAQDLKRAEAEFAALKAQSDKQGSNIYIQSELAALAKYIAKIKEAQSAKAGLTGLAADPREANPALTRGASYARWDQEQLEATKALNVERLKAAGVSKEYVASIKVHQDALRLGVSTEKEATTAIAKLVQKQYESSEAGKEAAKSAHAGAAANKAGASAAKAAASEYQGLLLRVNERISLADEEITAGRLLTDAQKQEIKLTETMDSAKSRLNATQRSAIELALDEVKAKEALVQQQRTNLAAEKDLAAAEAKRVQALESSLPGLAAQNQTMREELELLGLSEAAQLAITQARMSSTITIKEEQLARMQNTEFLSREQIALEEEIRLLKERQVLQGQQAGKNIAVAQAKEAESAWKTFYGDLERGLTDSLFRAFEAGKGFFSTLWSGIKNLFKTTVLKLAVQAVVGSVTGALGMSGAANAASGSGSNLLSNASSLYSATSSMVTLGSQVVAGTMSVANALGTVAANATGSGISGLLATNGAYGTAAAGSASSIAGSAMSVLGTIPGWGWAAMAAIAVASIFGGRGKKEATGGGIEGKFSGTGFAGNSFSTWKQDGGWFHNDRSGKDTAALDAATAKQFSDAYGAVKTSATAAAVSLGLSADAIASYSQDISLQLGSDAAANEKAVAALFAGIGDNMALAAAPGIALLAKEGEAAGSTLMRLSTSLTAANAWLSMLRQRLFQVGLAGGDAASKLADAFGGLENLSAASKAFYETYFTEGERAARSQEDMTSALAKFNLALPASKDGLRELADSLDLNTESGRNAYAVLLAIAPEFAAVADLASKFAKETADKLLKTFSGNGQLLPALDVAALKTALLGDTLVSTYTVAGNISKLFLDVNSGLLTFGTRTSTLTDGLTGAQLAALSLFGQIDALHQGADRTRIDFVGLSAALEGVNIETFTNTIALVLDNLATRIGSVIDSIGSERIALREAALQIINPTVMSKAAIERGIAGVNTKLPSNHGLVAAQQALGRADANVGTQKSAVDYARSLAPSTAAVDAARNALGVATAATAAAQARVDVYRTIEGGKFNSWVNAGFAGRSSSAFGAGPADSGERNALRAVEAYQSALAAAVVPQNAYNAQVAAYGKAVAVNAAQIAAAQAGLASATAAQAAAVTAARTAQTAYVASLQDFSIDASKAVGKLGKLREETVKYYDAQKQLADLMSNSADGLRTTVADYRYSQLSDAAQFDKLQADFAKNYAMALSTDGSMLAGYGDKLNAGLNPLLEKARDVLSGSAYDAFAATALARAEAIAGRLETLTPTNYAADSLAMLGQIDATLAALDASSKSAEKIISDAVTAGSDKTANGLRAVIAALTGKAIPAFAAGGAYQGGLALVGEKGPELINFNGGGQVYTAQQTRGMFAGGGNAEVVAELRALRQDNANMRAELRAIAGSSAKTARHLDRMDADGLLVRTDADTPLATVAA